MKAYGRAVLVLTSVVDVGEGHLQASTALPRRKSPRHVLDGLRDPRAGLNAFDEIKTPCAYNGNRTQIHCSVRCLVAVLALLSWPRSCTYYVFAM